MAADPMLPEDDEILQSCLKGIHILATKSTSRDTPFRDCCGTEEMDQAEEDWNVISKAFIKARPIRQRQGELSKLKKQRKELDRRIAAYEQEERNNGF
jgi:hypothetical protein